MQGGQLPKKRGRPRKDAGADLPNYMRPLPDMAPPGQEMPEFSLSEADSVIAQAQKAIARSNQQIEDFDRAEQLKRAAEQDVQDEWRAHAPPGEIIGAHMADIGNVFVHAVERGILNLNPLGAAVNAGLTLGDLSKKIMNLEETIQMRKKGTPRERAMRAYGEGIRARIEQRAKEEEFQRWYSDVAEKQGLDPNPDNPMHFYDYRAAHAAGAMPDSAGHWPSEFKREGHPNQFVDGRDTRTGKKVTNASRIRNAQERVKVLQQINRERRFR